MTEIRPAVFSFDSSFDVRVILSDGEPWFVAADIASVLGYGHVPHMVRMLDADEKGVQIVDTLGGAQSLSVINESGLYACILKSRRPEARAFRKWVTGTVLPSIRKTGAYQIREYPRTQPVRCSREQHQHLDAAIQRALLGLEQCEGYRMAVHNRLRVRFNLASIEDMTAEQFPLALEELRQIEQGLSRFFEFRADLKQFLLQEVIGGGAPWTPYVARTWKARMRTELPERPNWLAMQRQLAN